MSALINIPDFLIDGIDINKFSRMQKIYMIFYGKLISLIMKISNRKLMIRMLNILYSQSGKITYKKPFFIKEYNQIDKIYYPNLRVLRVAKGVNYQFEKILKDYCINDIGLKDDDFVIDCGSNVGELFLALKFKNININYFAFEPDKAAFDCLKENTAKNENKAIEIYNYGLSDKSGEKTFYLGTAGGDSSFEDFGSGVEISIQIQRLDSFNFNKIDLLKIDAEGHELEVLKGSSSLLKNIKFISVDYGLEKGFNQDSTITEVTNFLFENNFYLYSANLERNVGLFKNKAIDK